MSVEKLLGNNIRNLRSLFGESQEDLGFAIGVGKTTISNYERGDRYPDNETLKAIATHFMISVEELISIEIPTNKKINVNYNIFWDHIDDFLPITFSDTAFTNEHFKKAYIIHKDYFKLLKNQRFIDSDNIDIESCVDEYNEALKDKESCNEAAANLIAIAYFSLFMIKAQTYLQNDIAPMSQLIKNDPQMLYEIENAKEEWIKIKEIEKFDEDSANKEFQGDLFECLNIIKHNSHWSDLADYYLALQYLLDIADNKFKLDINRLIGIEMLSSFALLKNKYALNLLILLNKAT